MLKKIEDEWEDMNLTIVPYKLTEDSFILVETDAITQIIEDHLTTLETLQKSPNASHLKEKVVKW